MNNPKIKMLVLSLTGQCNFACKYCYASEHNEGKMSEATAIMAVKLAAQSGENLSFNSAAGSRC